MSVITKRSSFKLFGLVVWECEWSEIRTHPAPTKCKRYGTSGIQIIDKAS